MGACRRRGGLALFAAWVSACAPGREPSDPSDEQRAPSSADARSRRAPGVVYDWSPALPPPTSSAVPDRGLVVLREPPDVKPARRVIEAFFQAIVAESTDALEPLLERSAHTRAGSKARPEAALPAWRRRFDRLDYTPLASTVLYRASEVRFHRATDASPEARPLPVLPRGEQILVQVPLLPPSPGKLFGTEISFLLKPGSGGYKIEEMFEDFRLP